MIGAGRGEEKRESLGGMAIETVIRTQDNYGYLAFAVFPAVPGVVPLS